MSVIKTFDVGAGDMAYIEHNSANFTCIDCNILDDRESEILEEIKRVSGSSGMMRRFISTHADEDHIHGLKILDQAWGLWNFYVIKNRIKKPNFSEDFEYYKELRNSDIAFHIEKNCSRKWMSESDTVRYSADIEILWPNIENEYFKVALRDAEISGNANNTSIVLRYGGERCASAIWFGDLETEFMENIESDIDLERTTIVFAPHHGRKSGKLPESWLEKMQPKVVVLGRARSEHLYYYPGYNTLKQNSAGDIAFQTEKEFVHVFASNAGYSEPWLLDWNLAGNFGLNYIGTFLR